MNLTWPFHGWRRKVLVAVGSVTLVLTLTYALTQGSQYESSTTLYVNPNVARATTGTSDPGAQNVQISNFIRALSSPQAIEQAAAESGLSPIEVSNDLTVSQIGESNSVNANLVARDSEQSERALVALAQYALANYRIESLERINNSVDVYRQQYDDATRRLNYYLTSVNEADPQTRYNDTQQRLIDVEAGVAMGSSATLQGELDRLQPIVLRFRELLAQQSLLGEVQRDAISRQLDLQSAIANSDLAGDASTVDTAQLSRPAQAFRTSLLAVLAMTLLATAALYLVQLFVQRNWTTQGTYRLRSPRLWKVNRLANDPETAHLPLAPVGIVDRQGRRDDSDRRPSPVPRRRAGT